MKGDEAILFSRKLGKHINFMNQRLKCEKYIPT